MTVMAAAVVDITAIERISSVTVLRIMAVFEIPKIKVPVMTATTIRVGMIASIPGRSWGWRSCVDGRVEKPGTVNPLHFRRRPPGGRVQGPDA